MSIAELKEELRKKHFSVKGSKAVLLSRLQATEDTEMHTPSAGRHAQGTSEEEYEGTNSNVEDNVDPRDSKSQVSQVSRGSKDGSMSEVERSIASEEARKLGIMAEIKVLEEEQIVRNGT